MTAAADRLYRRRRPVNAAMAEALTETRWLTPFHRQRLAEGRLSLPSQANHFGHGGHPAVLVSVPQYLDRSPCAWIDREMAELIWLLNHRHDVDTIECCKGEPGYGERAYVAFPSRGDCNRFLALTGDTLRSHAVEGVWFQRCVRFDTARIKQVTRAVRNA